MTAHLGSGSPSFRYLQLSDPSSGPAAATANSRAPGRDRIHAAEVDCRLSVTQNSQSTQTSYVLVSEYRGLAKPPKHTWHLIDFIRSLSAKATQRFRLRFKAWVAIPCGMGVTHLPAKLCGWWVAPTLRILDDGRFYSQPPGFCSTVTTLSPHGRLMRRKMRRLESLKSDQVRRSAIQESA